MTPETEKLLSLSFLKGIGPSTLRKLAAVPGFASIALEELSAHVRPLARALGEPDAWRKAIDSAGQQAALARQHHTAILSPFDQAYPRLLARATDGPCVLFVTGTLPAAEQNVVAVVGTREPTAHGAVIASRVATHFAEQGWSIVSGLALGCDAIAHQASIDAGGHTVAVMAHGLQTVTPAQHRRLAEHILSSGGALVSEFPFGQEPLPQLFARRDRTQAGLAQGVIMIQSGLDGGSLHACRAALAYERWLAVPYPTERDLQDRSEKIHANVMLAEGTTEERTSLLSCKADALDRVVILRDKRDYDRLHHYEAPRTRDLLT